MEPRWKADANANGLSASIKELEEAPTYVRRQRASTVTDVYGESDQKKIRTEPQKHSLENQRTRQILPQNPTKKPPKTRNQTANRCHEASSYLWRLEPGV